MGKQRPVKPPPKGRAGSIPACPESDRRFESCTKRKSLKVNKSFELAAILPSSLRSSSQFCPCSSVG